MYRVRAVIVLGLLAVVAPGCAALKSRGLAPHAAGDRPSPLASSPPSLAESGAMAPDVDDDPFHAKPTTPVARLSRYFPGLTRPSSPSASSPGLLRRGARGTGAKDRELEAVPRPELSAPAGETTAASPPSWRDWVRASAKKKIASTPRTDPATRTASARGAEAVEAAAPPPPLLAAAVLAEVDPEPPAGGRVVASLPPVSGRRPVPGASGASSLPISVRRSPPPLPSIDPTARRPLPPRSRENDRDSGRPEALTKARPARSHEADDQAKQAAGLEEPEAQAPTPRPILAVSQPPVEEEPESPAPEARPEPEARPAPESPAAEARPEPGSPPALDPPAVDTAAPADRPPPIDDTPPTRPVDKDAGGDPTLVGRPRMSSPPAARISPRAGLPDDLPPPLFPRSYYGEKAPKVAPDPLISGDDSPKRWTWTPRIIKKLRGQ